MKEFYFGRNANDSTVDPFYFLIHSVRAKISFSKERNSKKHLLYPPIKKTSSFMVPFLMSLRSQKASSSYSPPEKESYLPEVVFQQQPRVTGGVAEQLGSWMENNSMSISFKNQDVSFANIL
jgi:hypothetical protein